MCILAFRILYISIKDKRQRFISTLLTFLILFVIIKYEYYDLFTSWLGRVWSDIGNELSNDWKDWYTSVFYWIILAIVVCSTAYIICMWIAFLWNKDKINQQREMSLTTLWLFWGIFGTIFWDMIKDFWTWKIEQTWFHFIFLLIFWWLTVYLSNTIESQKTWSTTSQPTSPHDEENTTSSSQPSE